MWTQNIIKAQNIIKLRKILPSIILSRQTSYFKNRNINDKGRLTSDVLES